MSIDVDFLSRFDFYNEDIKKRFLSELNNENSALTIAYTLSKATSTEKMFNTDLYSFNLQQIELVMKNIQPKNVESSKTYASFLRSYITWAIQNGYRSSNINLLSDLSDEWYDKFTINQKLFINDKQLLELENKLVNIQDKLVLRLAFNGITGKDLIEMRNLKFDDVKGSIAKVTDHNGKIREIQIDDKCVEYIEKSKSEETYLANNGLGTTRALHRPLKTTPFVLRPTQRVNTVDQIDKFAVLRRLRMIKEMFDYPLLSTKNLEKSGMIYMAVQLYKENGKFNMEEFEQIAHKYNLSKMMVDGAEYYKKTLYKDLFSKDTIQELYDIEMEVNL